MVLLYRGAIAMSNQSSAGTKDRAEEMLSKKTLFRFEIWEAFKCQGSTSNTFEVWVCVAACQAKSACT